MNRPPRSIANVFRIVTGSAFALLLLGCQRAQPPATCASSSGCSAAMQSAVPSTPPENEHAAVGGVTATGTVGVSGGMAVVAQSAPAVSSGAALPQAGVAGMAGMLASAGTMAGAAPNAAVGAAGSGSKVDALGVALALPGDSKTESHAYLNLGDFRILVNKWGSDELMCNTTMKVFVNTDKSFGWSFDRGGCGGNKQKPDYPEIEFGMHPFGKSGSSATTPTFSSTQVLPLQIKDIVSSTVMVDSLNAGIQKATTWNIDVEFWLSEKNPVTDAEPGVYAELIAFWGWQDSWGCDKSGSVTAGDKSYNLCHQDDHWGNGWRYYQFRSSTGSAQSYSGTVDIKAFLDWLVTMHSFSKELWLTRIEVGSEIDDNTAGSVTLKNLTFEVNGTAKSAQFGQ